MRDSPDNVLLKNRPFASSQEFMSIGAAWGRQNPIAAYQRMLIIGACIILILATRSELHAFDSHEHLQLGNQLTKDLILVSKSVPTSLSFGEATAIAADYVSTPEELEQLLVSQPDYIDYLKKTVRRDPQPSRSDNQITLKQKSLNNYLALAAVNFTHFLRPSSHEIPKEKYERTWKCGPSAISCYKFHHANAVKKATALYRKKTTDSEALPSEVLLSEAFAAHYLSDCYSSGHIRTRRYDMKEIGDSQYPMLMENFIWLSAERASEGLPGGLIFSDKNERIAEIEDGIRRQIPSNLLFGLGDLLSLAAHDYDNTYGLAVGSWKLYGDGHLTMGDTETVVLEALSHSIGEVKSAFHGESVAIAQNRDLEILQSYANSHPSGQVFLSFSVDKKDPMFVKGLEIALRDIVAQLSSALDNKHKITTILGLALNSKDQLTLATDVFVSRVFQRLSGVELFEQLLHFTPNIGIRNRESLLKYLQIAKENGALGTLEWSARLKMITELLTFLPAGFPFFGQESLETLQASALESIKELLLTRPSGQRQIDHDRAIADRISLNKFIVLLGNADVGLTMEINRIYWFGVDPRRRSEIQSYLDAAPSMAERDCQEHQQSSWQFGDEKLGFHPGSCRGSAERANKLIAAMRAKLLKPS